MAQSAALILAAEPARESDAQKHCSHIAHMAYRVDPGPRLMRLQGKMPGHGGLLFFTMEAGAYGGNVSFFLQQILRESKARNCIGVIADLPQKQANLAGQLDRLLNQNGLMLYVPEWHFRNAPHAKLLISTAISGGTLRNRLEKAIGQYGIDRVVPALEKVAEDIIPPAKTGRGRSLSQPEFEQLRQQIKPSIFWSPELCTRYFTYIDQGQVHFVLFDDRETLHAKLRLAGELGIRECLAAWEDIRQ